MKREVPGERAGVMEQCADMSALQSWATCRPVQSDAKSPHYKFRRGYDCSRSSRCL